MFKESETLQWLKIADIAVGNGLDSEHALFNLKSYVKVINYFIL